MLATNWQRAHQGPAVAAPARAILSTKPGCNGSAVCMSEPRSTRLPSSDTQ
jgi:hypothetical protein